MIEVELGEFIGLADTAWVETLYEDVVEELKIKEFFQTTKVHCNGRWVTLPEDVPGVRLTDGRLYEPYVELINLILRWFVLDPGEEKALRKAINTHTKNLAHQESHQTIRWSRPDVSVKAEGSSFQEPESKTGNKFPEVGFFNTSSFTEMKVENQDISPKEQVLQVGVYVR